MDIITTKRLILRFFRRDPAGKPIWSDTCVYALPESDLPEHGEKEDPTEC